MGLRNKYPHVHTSFVQKYILFTHDFGSCEPHQIDLLKNEKKRRKRKIDEDPLKWISVGSNNNNDRTYGPCQVVPPKEPFIIISMIHKRLSMYHTCVLP